jgi:signal transduction histidine kinase
VRVELASELPRLVTARAPLEQVFMNLVANALHHGGRPDLTIRIAARDAGEWLEFSVRNDGVPIPPERLQHIWAPFYSTKDAGAGSSTGVGLAVVRRIVETRGGQVQVTSDERGTTFTFTWPRHEPLPREARGQAPHAH